MKQNSDWLELKGFNATKDGVGPSEYTLDNKNIKYIVRINDDLKTWTALVYHKNICYTEMNTADTAKEAVMGAIKLMIENFTAACNDADYARIDFSFIGDEQ